MKKRFRLFFQFFVMLLLLISSLSNPLNTKAADQPSVDFSVTPSASEYTLNADGQAEGILNVSIIPKGKVIQNEREPIDVVFVHDTSGSMDDFFEKKKKSISAQSALTEAINYFKQNKKTNDNFYFIPFNDSVRTSGNVKVAEGLVEIEKIAKNLDKNNTGGTNYTETLEYAKSLLEKSKNKNKYIIFLTDGEPTVLQKGKWKYILYTNGQALYEGKTSSKNYSKTKALIHETALQTSDELSKNNIRMYSIGFAKEDEIDFQLLEKMSTKTGGYAIRATPDNLTKVFQEISKKINSYTISGEVTIDLRKFAGNVVADTTSNAFIDDNQVVHIPFNFNFPVGQQPDPSSMNITLPLVFKQAGKYTFDNIMIQYNEQSPISHSSFDITINKDANAVPGATFSVKPSAEEFIKPPKGNAKGNIDVTITPKGMAPRDERLPIDVVFVHDTSGSMAYEWDGVRRDTIAKNALISAIGYFEEHAKDQDKFFFVPFDSNVSKKDLKENILKVIGTIEPVEGLSKIKSTADFLDYNLRYLLGSSVASLGGTNYNAALNEAVKKYGTDSKRNKYIIFLTDGEPSVLSYNNDEYIIYGSGSNQYAEKNGKRINLEDTKDIIHNQALNLSSTIGNQGITMYSIGFANEDDVDFELLKNMSSRTGGYAVQGNSNNLTGIFNDISKKVNATTISGNVMIDLKKFNGDVIVDSTSNFQEKNGMVQIPFNITFPVGEKPDPSLIEQSLPLQFKKAGNYNFDNITMTYTDINGSEKTVKSDPFTVNVKEETAPYFLNEVDIKGNKDYPPDGLVKIEDKDTESNEFTVEYKLIPDTVFTEITEGTITNMKIVQPLPEGISLASTNQIKLYQNGDNEIAGATVNIIDNGKKVEISMGNNNINYESGKFSIDDFTIKLKLKADWALPFTVLPQATLNFYDSRFENQEQSLNIDEQRISMKVLLEGSNYQYFGDYSGLIEKVGSSNGEILAEAQLLDDENLPIQKPIKEMKFINDEKAIEVTYNDDTKAVLYLKTDFILKNLSFSEDLQSGAITKGKVGFKITDYVAGDNVVYEYQLSVDNEKTEWKSFDPTTYIELSKDLEGLVEIRVRTKGGFTSDSKPVIKTVTIIKESIQVEPNPLELNVGDSVDVHMRVTPDDGTAREFNVSVLNESIAKYENGKIIGIKDGETKLIVTTVDIAGDEIRKEVKIKVNPVLITRLTVTPNPVKIKKFGEFNDFTININPVNASNKNLVWKSLNPSIVSIIEPGKIYGKATGTAEIEIRANDSSNVRTTIEVIVGSPLIGISVPDELVIEKGTTDNNVNDYLTYHPSDATNIKGDPTFNSTNKNILEVEPDGEIIPKRIGNAAVDIQVKDEDNKTFSTSLKVKVVEKQTNGNHDKDKY